MTRSASRIERLRGKGNMTDERIDPIDSVTAEPTCEPCNIRLGIMDGTAAFSDAMARLWESAS